jgi:hypothetical protein
MALSIDLEGSEVRAVHTVINPEKLRHLAAP